MNRRAYLTAVGVGSLAGVTGCIANVVGTGMDPAEDPWQGVETTENGSTTTVEGELVLPQDTYATRRYQPEGSFELAITYEVEGENPVDLYTMRPEEFDNYAEGDNAVFFTAVSKENAPSGDVQGLLEAGEYVVVFDNTSWGDTSPNGEETMSFSISVESGG